MELSSNVKTLVDQIAQLGQNVPSDRAPSPEVHRELKHVTKQLSFALEEPFETVQRLVSAVGKNGSHDGVPSAEVRRELRHVTKQLSFAIEDPWETMQRLAFPPLHYAIVRIGIDLGLFEYLLDAGPNGKTADELVKKTGVDATFLPRLLRSLATSGLVSQLDQDRWAATTLSRSIMIPTVRSGIKFMFDFMGPVFQKLPEYLLKTQYQNPTADIGPLQYAWDTKLTAFDYVAEPHMADIRKDFNIFMKGRRDLSKSWLDFYPFAEQIVAGSESKEDSVLVVDVGGGLGQVLVKIREKFPDLQGKLILEDLPKTVQQAELELEKKDMFEAIGHDFFTPQPVKGARAYFIRQVLHDWPDKECQTILKQVAAAMTKDYSKILLNEVVIPDYGPSERFSAVDLVMLGLSGGMERTEAQWRDLAASAGLRVDRIWTLDDSTESVIEVVLA